MSLLQMSFTGAVMITAIIVIRFLALYKLPKKAFSVLWGIALLRLLLPFSLPSPFSIYHMIQPLQPYLEGKSEFVTLSKIPIQAAFPQSQALFSIWSLIWGFGMFLCNLFFAVTYWKCRKEFQSSFPIENRYILQWLSDYSNKGTIQIRQSEKISAH